jgi:hypothetical protein
MLVGDQADGEAEEGFVDVVVSFPADARMRGRRKPCSQGIVRSSLRSLLMPE